VFIDPKYDDEPNAVYRMASRVLIPCCSCLNRVLDALVDVGGPANLPHLVPSDFWSLRVRYEDATREVASFNISKLHTVWWGPSAASLQGPQTEFRARLADQDGLPISDELLVSAERKEEGGDYRGAVIDAVCAIESSVGVYLADMLDRRGISKKKQKDFLGPSGPGIALRTCVLLPMLHESEVPPLVLDAVSVANSK
jgi:hypothetical protein